MLFHHWLLLNRHPSVLTGANTKRFAKGRSAGRWSSALAHRGHSAPAPGKTRQPRSAEPIVWGATNALRSHRMQIMSRMSNKRDRRPLEWSNDSRQMCTACAGHAVTEHPVPTCGLRAWLRFGHPTRLSELVDLCVLSLVGTATVVPTLRLLFCLQLTRAAAKNANTRGTPRVRRSLPGQAPALALQQPTVLRQGLTTAVCALNRTR
jgi:hypothetical protein